MMDNEYNTQLDNDENNLLNKLKTIWINEKFAPNLLDYQNEIISNVMEKIEEKEALCTEGIQNKSHQFTADIYEMEIERLKYIVKCYLRLRIKKIDQFYTSVLKESQSNTELLSQHELKYTERYKSYMDEYFKKTILSSLHKDHSTMSPDHYLEPQLNTWVFCKPKENLGEYLIDEDTIDFKKTSIYFVKYRPIKDLVQAGRMDLI
ncbi:hypothetical protein DICPUDRAFT_79109 [Dictyostelium purpureum]|uniref:DNA replication complex GINS protein SLD5 n=1 Tax=Dictyostelium purpureum TaxID=5786 RepID=F0ZLL1_DICPU|nr:uncharacterized protein DICPUDRAFT_79109 [Dictyostelium purpureum]EGC35173.1 hypothetical protein DICPUDRAFT_79109 [Dictyostelium purpureum]|eukprot:XP_003288311.1 hypothetical protein DICPUDRAFT_79109 [Dictyostelium purpureum]